MNLPDACKKLVFDSFISKSIMGLKSVSLIDESGGYTVEVRRIAIELYCPELNNMLSDDSAIRIRGRTQESAKILIDFLHIDRWEDMAEDEISLFPHTNFARPVVLANDELSKIRRELRAWKIDESEIRHAYCSVRELEGECKMLLDLLRETGFDYNGSFARRLAEARGVTEDERIEHAIDSVNHY